ncbi:hypothetical protein A0J48_009160 [Sphaerospermopsis aphanizomenoides BCCUSP55]|uniref:hypothetical protein n=1 Tax=Sphaerospermopsis aphanizomenoides TaxID=459663 RepID=UPI000A96108A|nr:hypothetical protein [Sphaerospermopsis aphanizomenoides]MBK1987702.1 hypothetical protein [Sphaerospermopsis aphanizomenoides BCCUSP55]
MSIAVLKTRRWMRVIAGAVSSIGTIGTAMILSGCTIINIYASEATWKTYSNTRYSFEFPYPSNWNSSGNSDNNDGIAFVAPNNRNVEMRAWASRHLEVSIQDQYIREQTQNFQTAEGVFGVLSVDVGQQTTSMTLTISQGQVKYHWQGQSNSKEFKEYYRLFYYVAKQYKIR